MKLCLIATLLLTACAVNGSPTYFPACPRGVGLGEVFSTDGCNDCLFARTGPACTGYTCMQCRPGQIFYRDMCNKCLCGLKGTYACESNPCHQELFGAWRWCMKTMEWSIYFLHWIWCLFSLWKRRLLHKHMLHTLSCTNTCPTITQMDEIPKTHEKKTHIKKWLCTHIRMNFPPLTGWRLLYWCFTNVIIFRLPTILFLFVLALRNVNYALLFELPNCL